MNFVDSFSIESYRDAWRATRGKLYVRDYSLQCHFSKCSKCLVADQCRTVIGGFVRDRSDNMQREDG